MEFAQTWICTLTIRAKRAKIKHRCEYYPVYSILQCAKEKTDTCSLYYDWFKQQTDRLLDAYHNNDLHAQTNWAIELTLECYH